jgi:hypothetical protein
MAASTIGARGAVETERTMTTLRTAAWINVGLHAVGLVLAAAAMRPGTPAAPLLERIRLAARPAG